MEHQYHEEATEPQSKKSDFSYAPPVSVFRPRQEPELRVIVIPIGLLVSVVMLVAYLLNPVASAERLVERSFNAGNSAYDALDYNQAIAKFDEAIRLKPDFGEAYYNRGTAPFQDNNF